MHTLLHRTCCLCRLQQTETVAGAAARAANGAVSGLAWAGAKLADGGERASQKPMQSAAGWAVWQKAGCERLDPPQYELAFPVFLSSFLAVLWLAGANKPGHKEPGRLREVSHAALAGFAEVWDAMEDAGRLVLLSARDGVADVVSKK